MLGLGFEAIKIDLTHVLIGNLSSMLRCNPYKLINSPRCTWMDFFSLSVPIWGVPGVSGVYPGVPRKKLCYMRLQSCSTMPSFVEE